MKKQAASERIRVRRMPERARYDPEDIYPIVDAALICHVGFVVDGQPFVIPMALARDGDSLYLHGPNKGRIMSTLSRGTGVCVTITHLDGLVLAKSQFHHSMNYRSAILFGTCRAIESEKEKLEGLKKLVAHLASGQETYARAANQQELKATVLLKFDIEEASAKIRTGAPKDDPGDEALDLWSGVIDLETRATKTRPKSKTALPPHIRALFESLKG